MRKQVCLLAALLIFPLAGCVDPGAGSSKSIRWNEPPAGAYYKGEAERFAGRFNPDPLGRKFRVAHLSVHATKCDDFKNARQAMAEAIKGDVAAYYMVLREQARHSPAREALSDEMVKLRKDICRREETFVLNWLANARDPKKLYSMASPRDHAFLEGYPRQSWLQGVNAQLAARYPDLFSAESSAFPLDVAMEILFDGSGPDRFHSLHEAWLLGLPEHASITFHDTVTEDAIFRAEEGYADPYEAITAAVFKLTDAQFEGLEPANPRDREWLEEK